MAKELMEIGGFITSGAEIVNHDNTLSGNGTVDNPLGVVPGYNETVLWSGDRFTTGYRDLNESFLNFERLRFKIKTEDQDNWGYFEYPSVNTAQYFNASIHQIWPGTTAASWIKNGLWVPVSETRISGNYQALQRITTGGISNNIQTTGNWMGIYEIVGINRKAQ